MQNIIIHSGKHLTNGKTTIVYTLDGRKHVLPDDDTPPTDAFQTARMDLAIHAAIAFGLARSEDYEIETGLDNVPRPRFKNPGFAKLFNPTGFTVDKKGMLTLSCTWHGAHKAGNFNADGINTNFESNNGYQFLQDLLEMLAQFRFQCGKYIEGAQGERKVAPPKVEENKLKETELPFGTPGGTDVTEKYIGPNNELINKETGPGAEEVEPLENFQNNTARTADQSKPSHLSAKRGGGKGNEQTAANPSGT